MRFFSYDSKFGQIMVKLTYGTVLNMLWLVCCLPVFTVGASTTALYYAALKMAKGEESYPMRMFFHAFKENFRQATVVWLIMLPIGCLLAGDGYIVYHLRAASTGAAGVFWTLLLAVLIAAAVVYVIVYTFVFPLVASVSNTTFNMFKNALFIGCRYLFCTITVFAIHFVMFFLVVRVFTPLIIFGEGLCAVLSAGFLRRVIEVCSYDPNAPVPQEGEEEDAEEEETGE